VLVVDRQLDLAQRTVEMIAEEGGDAVACAADVTDDAQCRTMVEAALTQFGASTCWTTT
jgi:NAD(P)-dependent dehydrogenase (short-subunit alcohol dehydrogenase family)